jgi:hypothetical protein
MNSWVYLFAGLDALEKWKSLSLTGIEHELPSHLPRSLSTNTGWAISANFYAANKTIVLHFFSKDLQPNRHFILKMGSDVRDGFIRPT